MDIARIRPLSCASYLSWYRIQPTHLYRWSLSSDPFERRYVARSDYGLLGVRPPSPNLWRTGAGLSRRCVARSLLALIGADPATSGPLKTLSPPSRGPARHSRDRSLENQGRIERKKPAVAFGNNGLSTRKAPTKCSHS